MAQRLRTKTSPRLFIRRSFLLTATIESEQPAHRARLIRTRNNVFVFFSFLSIAARANPSIPFLLHVSPPPPQIPHHPSPSKPKCDQEPAQEQQKQPGSSLYLICLHNTRPRDLFAKPGLPGPSAACERHTVCALNRSVDEESLVCDCAGTGAAEGVCVGAWVWATACRDRG